MKTTFVDMRPIDVNLKNLSVIDGDITNLPYGDGELESVSCLHVIEHIGLGRYGDSLDTGGSVKAIKELQRILKKDGRLYISTPLGKPRLCFNAHRVFSPDFIISQFDQLSLVSFSVVDDSGSFSEHVEIPEWVRDQDYACGMFCFTK
jgi:SAM-dependent methyltransferase